jgi:hypothetical protein
MRKVYVKNGFVVPPLGGAYLRGSKHRFKPRPSPNSVILVYPVRRVEDRSSLPGQ